MQRSLFPSRVATFGMVLFLASAACADEVPPAEELFARDVEACTTQANEDAQANADTSEDGGDAQSLFYACMLQKGHTQNDIDALEDEH